MVYGLWICGTAGCTNPRHLHCAWGWQICSHCNESTRTKVHGEASIPVWGAIFFKVLKRINNIKKANFETLLKALTVQCCKQTLRLKPKFRPNYHRFAWSHSLAVRFRWSQDKWLACWWCFLSCICFTARPVIQHLHSRLHRKLPWGPQRQSDRHAHNDN